MDPWSYLERQEKNDDIRRILGVARITDKVREARLRWYGHIQRREEDDCVKRILEGKRRWTTEQRKTEKELDRRRQAQHGGPAAQRGGGQESS